MSLGEERELLKNPFLLINLPNKYDVIVKVGFFTDIDTPDAFETFEQMILQKDLT